MTKQTRNEARLMSEETKTPKPNVAKATKRTKPEGKVASAVSAANKAEAAEKKAKEAARKERLAQKKTAEAEAKKAERKARHMAKQAEKEAAKKEAAEAKQAEKAKQETKQEVHKRDSKTADEAVQKYPLNKADAKEEKIATKREKTKREKKKREPFHFDFSWASIKAWWLERPLALGIVAAAILLVVMLYPPTCSYYAALRTNAVLSEQLSSVNTERDDLQSDVDKLTSEDGIKDEARRRGYVDEGDTAVDMEGIEDTGGASSDITVLQQQSSVEEQEIPWYLQALDFIFQYNPENEGLGQ